MAHGIAKCTLMAHLNLPLISYYCLQTPLHPSQTPLHPSMTPLHPSMTPMHPGMTPRHPSGEPDWGVGPTAATPGGYGAPPAAAATPGNMGGYGTAPTPGTAETPGAAGYAGEKQTECCLVELSDSSLMVQFVLCTVCAWGCATMNVRPTRGVWGQHHEAWLGLHRKQHCFGQIVPSGCLVCLSSALAISFCEQRLWLSVEQQLLGGLVANQ